MISRGIHCHSRIDGLQQRAGVDAGDEEAPLIQGLRPLCRGANANRREGVSHRSKERRFLGKGAGIRHNRKSIHLQAIIIVEAQRLVLDHARVELDPSTGLRIRKRGLQPFPGAGVAAVQNRHIILRGHGVDGREEGKEVLFRVDVLFPVRGQKDVSTFFET